MVKIVQPTQEILASSDSIKWAAYPDGDKPSGGGPSPVAESDFAGGFEIGDSSPGITWASATYSNTYPIPSGETDPGLNVYYEGKGLDPTQDANSERRFQFSPTENIYIYEKFFVPSNYFHRYTVGIDVTGDISSWQLGDTCQDDDGTSEGTIYYITGQRIYLLFADNSNGDGGVWSGTTTNTTRSEARSTTRDGFEADNNKFFALWCDGYSSSGQSPTITFEQRSTGDGGSNIYFHWGADGSNTGGLPNSEQAGQATAFIRPADFGTYMEVYIVAEMASSEVATDGVIELWVKRDGESVFSKLVFQNDALLGPRAAAGANNIWENGYIFGAANSGFEVDTNMNIPNLKLYDERPAEITE